MSVSPKFWATALGGLIWLSVAGCSGVLSPKGVFPGFSLPAAKSPSPSSLSVLGDDFYAGFAREDITLKVGAGLNGYGPHGKISKGWRTRLYSKALVLVDKNNERLALVSADLSGISPIIHRLAAEKVVEKTGIGAERLIITATHTHASPGHYFDGEMVNKAGSQKPGFDEKIARFIADKIAKSVERAFLDLKKSKVSWAEAPLWGFTQNRSLAAHNANQSLPKMKYKAPNHLSGSEKAVDPAVTILRVDQYDESKKKYIPRGGFGIFAVHGTVFPSGNDLMDSDIHGSISIQMEKILGEGSTFLVANGPAGDNSPVTPKNTRCIDKSCLHKTRAFNYSQSLKMAKEFHKVFIEAKKDLTNNYSLKQSFQAITLKPNDENLLCKMGAVGTAGVIGAEDGRTSFYRLHFGPIDLTFLGFDEGEDATSQRFGCQNPKRILMGDLHQFFTQPHGYAAHAQASVVRVGPALFGTIPMESTLGAGLKMSEAIEKEAQKNGFKPKFIRLVSITNGYVHYVTTKEEYAKQHYEGGMTVYGPNTEKYMRDHLSQMTAVMTQRQKTNRSLASVDDQSGFAFESTPLEVFPGERINALFEAEEGFPKDKVKRKFQTMDYLSTCEKKSDDSHFDQPIQFTWTDLNPGEFDPSAGVVFHVERKNKSGEWIEVARDGSFFTEVRNSDRQMREGHLWQGTWFPLADEAIKAMSFREHRLVLTKRQGFEAVTSKPFKICSN